MIADLFVIIKRLNTVVILSIAIAILLITVGILSNTDGILTSQGTFLPFATALLDLLQAIPATIGWWRSWQPELPSPRPEQCRPSSTGR